MKNCHFCNLDSNMLKYSMKNCHVWPGAAGMLWFPLFLFMFSAFSPVWASFGVNLRPSRLACRLVGWLAPAASLVGPQGEHNQEPLPRSVPQMMAVLLKIMKNLRTFAHFSHRPLCFSLCFSICSDRNIAFPKGIFVFLMPGIEKHCFSSGNIAFSETWRWTTLLEYYLER